MRCFTNPETLETTVTVTSPTAPTTDRRIRPSAASARREGRRNILAVFFAAGVLIVAAALKLYALVTAPVGDSWLLAHPWLTAALIQAELALGVWLCARVYVRAAWLTAVGCFVVFTAFAAVRVLTQQETCGCLGAVEPRPGWMLLLNTSVLALLLYGPPGWRASRGTESM